MSRQHSRYHAAIPPHCHYLPCSHPYCSHQAGVHSGDSACSIPTQSIPSLTLRTIREWTVKVAKALKVVGLINIQYAIQVCAEDKGLAWPAVHEWRIDAPGMALHVHPNSLLTNPSPCLCPFPCP